MRRRFISWGLALGLGLPGGAALISSAHAEAPESAGSAAQQAEEAAKRADQAAEQADEAAKTAGKAADQAGEATERASDKAMDTASSPAATGKDAKIEEAVEKRLERADMEDGVDVQAKDGVVTLSGTVDSEKMRGRIVETATKTEGVKDVNDHLTVEGIHREGSTPARR